MRIWSSSIPPPEGESRLGSVDSNLRKSEPWRMPLAMAQVRGKLAAVGIHSSSELAQAVSSSFFLLSSSSFLPSLSLT